MACIDDVKRGDTFELLFTWTQNDEVLPLTGCTARLHIKQLREDTALIEAVSGTELTIDEGAGTVTMVIPDADMAELTPGKYQLDLEVTFPTGKVLSTATIDFNVVKDITV